MDEVLKLPVVTSPHTSFDQSPADILGRAAARHIRKDLGRRTQRPLPLAKNTITLGDTLNALESVSLGYYGLHRQRRRPTQGMRPSWHKKVKPLEKVPWFKKPPPQPRMRHSKEAAVLREVGKRGWVRQEAEAAVQEAAAQQRVLRTTASADRVHVLPLIA